MSNCCLGDTFDIHRRRSEPGVFRTMKRIAQSEAQMTSPTRGLDARRRSAGFRR